MEVPQGTTKGWWWWPIGEWDAQGVKRRPLCLADCTTFVGYSMKKTFLGVFVLVIS